MNSKCKDTREKEHILDCGTIYCKKCGGEMKSRIINGNTIIQCSLCRFWEEKENK